jgi:GNAT superfamily N-acetyltransferase
VPEEEQLSLTLTEQPSHDVWLPLERSTTPLVSVLELDEITQQAVAKFDYSSVSTEFYPWKIPEDLPEEYGIGLIVGGSGTGKTVLLEEFGTPSSPAWDNNKTIASHFDDHEMALQRFYAVGLSSVPAWTKPYGVLSNGEKFRANLARLLTSDTVIDEFTSVVDRTVAKASSKTMRKYVEECGIQHLVLASCHHDIIPWLEPDWIIDTDSGMYCIKPKECLHREPMVAEIYEVKREMWGNFMEHHYLTKDIHRSATCFLAVVEGRPAGFASSLYFPSGSIQNAYREHRTVVKPDFQGLGLGPRMADWLGEYYLNRGFRFFSRSKHGRLGEWREASPRWRATSTNKKARLSKDAKRNNDLAHWGHARQWAYSHEYVGDVAEVLVSEGEKI